MPDMISSQLARRLCLTWTPRLRLYWILVFARFAVDGGARSAPGYDPYRRVVLCPWCGKKVRLKADGWGYCSRCRADFDGSNAEGA
jgi:hypothetical protein